MKQQQTKAPHIAWLEEGVLKSVVLTPTLRAKPSPLKKTSFERIIDIGLSARGYILAVKADGTETLLGLGEKEGIAEVWEFTEDVKSQEEKSNSVWAGGVDGSGEVFVTRVYWSDSIQVRWTLFQNPYIPVLNALI